MYEHLAYFTEEDCHYNNYSGQNLIIGQSNQINSEIIPSYTNFITIA